jgi:YVTN family beta-propeller protein
VAVNPVTNKIYVANYISPGASVTVIDGATNDTSLVAVMNYPEAMALNPVTNRIFVAGSNTVMVIDGASNDTAVVAAGNGPWASAVNPVTGRIYVANMYSDNVTVIDEATNDTATVAAGSSPYAVAVNPVTDKIYVANYGSDNITVIDGATNTPATVAAGSSPYAVAVNPVTNSIYVANSGSNNVTVIDGPTNARTNVAAGGSPYAIAVNPATNMVYTANYTGNNVTVINGATNATTTVAAGTAPYAVAVNPVTNRIYVANNGSDNVTVINGATNALVATVPAGSAPTAVAVNQLTNRIYVVNSGSDNVTVINGANNTTATVATGAGPYAVAVDPVRNQIYVTNSNGASTTVIDGLTNSATTVAAGNSPEAVSVDPVTGKIYVANNGSNNVTAISEAQISDTKVRALIDTLPRNSTTLARPALTGKGVNRWTPKPTTRIEGVVQGLKSIEHPWTWTAITAGAGSDSITWSWSWGPDSLLKGENYVLGVALESDAGITNNLGLGTPFAGNLFVYPVYRLNLPPPTLVSPLDRSAGQPLSQTFSWNTVNEATSYTLQVSGDSLFSTFLYNGSVSTTSQAVGGLSVNTTYFWRVNAGNVSGSSDWSGFRRFTTTDISLPSTVVTIAPADSAVIVVDSVRLAWNIAAPAVDRYLVEVSTDTNMTVLVANDSTVTDTSRLITSLVNNTTYYWRVKAHNTAGWGNYSSETRFVTSFSGVLFGGSALRAFSLKNTSGVLHYTLPKQCFVSVKYYDIRGRMVASFVGRVQGGGSYWLRLPVSSWGTGAYIQVFTAGEIVRKDRVMVVK